ncbi:MAG: hypothetical protein K9I82_10365 [Chitinophagaceae bacterium]|nr:hypothetical protein [Chitinophagaceae bacterium]
MRVILFFALLLINIFASSQELYVFSEPASNMPAKSLSIKYSGKFMPSHHNGKMGVRNTAEMMLGVNKFWMVHAAATFANLYAYPGLHLESGKLYAKYRFLSIDDIHKHFRAAAFLEASINRYTSFFQELSLDGDQSGVQGGLIATQLLHKLALSGTLSVIKTLKNESWKPISNANVPFLSFQAINYSFSAGLLVFPLKYSSFNQTNLNLYIELLGSKALDKPIHFVDIAPAAQLIFNANTKFNAGYRFQVNGNMLRMANQSYFISLERTFLNIIKNKK